MQQHLSPHDQYRQPFVVRIDGGDAVNGYDWTEVVWDRTEYVVPDSPRTGVASLFGLNGQAASAVGQFTLVRFRAIDPEGNPTFVCGDGTGHRFARVTAVPTPDACAVASAVLVDRLGACSWDGETEIRLEPLDGGTFAEGAVYPVWPAGVQEEAGSGTGSGSGTATYPLFVADLRGASCQQSRVERVCTTTNGSGYVTAVKELVIVSNGCDEVMRYWRDAAVCTPDLFCTPCAQENWCLTVSGVSSTDDRELAFNTRFALTETSGASYNVCQAWLGVPDPATGWLATAVMTYNGTSAYLHFVYGGGVLYGPRYTVASFNCLTDNTFSQMSGYTDADWPSTLTVYYGADSCPGGTGSGGGTGVTGCGTDNQYCAGPVTGSFAGFTCETWNTARTLTWSVSNLWASEGTGAGSGMVLTVLTATTAQLDIYYSYGLVASYECAAWDCAAGGSFTLAESNLDGGCTAVPSAMGVDIGACGGGGTGTGPGSGTGTSPP